MSTEDQHVESHEEILARYAAESDREYRRFCELYPGVMRIDPAAITYGDYACACIFLKEFAPLFQIRVSAAEVQQGSAPDAKAIERARDKAENLATFFATTREKKESE